MFGNAGRIAKSLLPSFNLIYYITPLTAVSKHKIRNTVRYKQGNSALAVIEVAKPTLNPVVRAPDSRTEGHRIEPRLGHVHCNSPN